MTNRIFFEAIEHIIDKTPDERKPNSENPLLILCDGHSSRYEDADCIRRLHKKHVFFYITLPNGTSYVSVLDMQVFKMYQGVKQKKHCYCGDGTKIQRVQLSSESACLCS